MNGLKVFKNKFDPYIKEFLSKKIKDISIYTKDPSIHLYTKYIETIVMSGGKRIRPYIAFFMYQLLGGGETEKILKLLVSLELFHAFCLVHDDVIDKADLRHRVPTVNKFIQDNLKSKKRLNDLNHTGNSQAILAGDLLFSWSQEILNLNLDISNKKLGKIRKLFYEMVDEICIGQMIDVDITTRKNVSKELINEKTYLKTAGYSFIKPLQIGAVLAGKRTNDVEKFCKEFGLTIGTAFQVQDDLLDIISSDKKLGKTASLDKSQNQHTYFTYFPSLEHGKEIISANFEQARDLIKNLSIDENSKKKFFDLVDIIQERTF